MKSLGIIIIGRNEGARLIRALEALPTIVPCVYVDSGSQDNSLAEAQKRGLITHALDPSQPFTAARARNEGAKALVDAGHTPEILQFFDGDCVVEQGWLAAGLGALAEDQEIGLVTGWRREINPNASIFNAMADHEWHRPAGDIRACSGDLMVRRDLFDRIGGFDPRVIAAEDDEFCVRLAKTGARLVRLPVAMSTHDADMHNFAQWWQRAQRSGHGFAQVGHLHPRYFRRERMRVLVYGVFLPLLAIFLALSGSATFWLVPLAFLWSYARAAKGLRHEGLPLKMALHQALFLTLSKLPNAIGMAQFYLRLLTRRDMKIIEYK